MALERGGIDKERKTIPLLDIGPVKTDKDTLEERARRWQLAYEAQLHVDWEATTRATRREGAVGQAFFTARRRYRDMHNLIVRPPTTEEIAEFGEKVGMEPGEKWGLVEGVKEKRPDRKNARIYVYRFFPEKVFENLGFKSPLPPGAQVMHQELMFPREKALALRHRLLRRSPGRLGQVKTCAFCHEPFLSKKKQVEPYSCTKHRCRKAKTRQREKGGKMR
jgi:hypothetical protein